MMSTPVEEESVTTIDVYTGCGSLGVSIVGGIDTPLVTHSALLSPLKCCAAYKDIPSL